MGIRIKDAELVKQITGNEKIPVSDGSDKPRTVNVNQIKAYTNKGMASEEYVVEQIKKIPTPNVSDQIDEHNKDKDAHPLIQNKIASAISSALKDYVKKDGNKVLSSNDFTDTLKAKLEGLKEFDATGLENQIKALSEALDTLVSGNSKTAIESFNEIIAFLENVSDKDTLEGILAGVAASIPTKVSQLDNDKKFVTTEEVDSKLEALTGNDLLALEISEVGEVSVTYGEKSDFVGGQIRETGELVLEFNIE